MALLVLISAMALWTLSAKLTRQLEATNGHAGGAIALAEAQNALWQLRYGFPQFMVSEPPAQKKIADDEKIWKAKLEDALKVYSAGDISAEEAEALKNLQEIYTKYMAARPKWFELYGAGKIEEAKEWRAATTTPFGAGTVKGFSDLIALQKKMSAGIHAEAISSLETTRKVVLGFGLLAVCIAAGIALSIVRSLMKQLGGEPVDATDISQRIAGGDLAFAIPTDASDRSSLIYSMKMMRDSLANIVSDVRGGTDALASVSGQIASGNLELSSRTEEQACSLQATAAAMEKLTSTVNQNADNARQANQLAVSASDVAIRGGAVVSQVVETMSAINDSAKKIADIISVIDGIAFQTNILALNAAVEAARAGEQGRGFAVVATEVRNLAQRSASAAKEIKTLIGDSVEKVDAGSKLVAEAGSTMNEVVSSVRHVTDMMGEITAASQEQRAGIAQVNQAVSRMDQVTQQNVALVEEAAAAAETLQQHASVLAQVVSVFRLSKESSALDAGASRAVTQKTRFPDEGIKRAQIGRSHLAKA